MELSRAVDDRTDTLGLDNRPDKECDASNGYDNRLGGEKVAATKNVRVSGRYIQISWRAHILWMGNQMAGREISQNRKKHIKSRVVMPADSGILFAASNSQ